MELAGIEKTDIVRCELRGITFFAFVLGRDEAGLDISVLERHKLPRGLPVPRVTAHQVTGVWRQGGRRRRPAARRVRKDHERGAAIAG